MHKLLNAEGIYRNDPEQKESVQKSLGRGIERALNIRNRCRNCPKQAGIYTDIPQNKTEFRNKWLRRDTQTAQKVRNLCRNCPEQKESLHKWLRRDTERAQNVRNLCSNCPKQEESIQK